MPWKIEKRNDKFCVIKTTDSSVEKCHDTRDKALAHQKALYAAEAKDKDMNEQETKAKEQSVEKEQSQKGYVPYGINSFAELDDYRQSREIASQVYDTTDDLFGLISSTVENPDVAQKGAHIVNLAQEYARRVDATVDDLAKEKSANIHDLTQDNLLSKIADVVKSTVKSLFVKDDDSEITKDNNFVLFKDKNENLRWFARYSNNFRDDDKPAEIISSKSHHRFVELVDKGVVDMPVLEVWHVPQWRIGVTDWVAYDETGFALASGTIDEGKEEIAKELARKDGVLMSHGMPISSLKRDPDDDSVIVEHITEEISILPQFAAANKFTGWELIGEQSKSKEDDMAIPAKKLNALVDNWGVDPEMLKSLQERNVETAKAAKEEGRESKEKDTDTESAETETVEASEGTTQTEDTAQAQDEQKQDETQDDNDMSEHATRQEVVDAFAPILAEMNTQIGTLTEQVSELAKELKSVKESEEVRIADKAREAPAASIASLLGAQMRAVGNKDTEIDGRSSLAKSKPEETASEISGPFPVPFLNELVQPKQ